MKNTMKFYKKVSENGARVTLWEETYTTEDDSIVYQRLASAMVRKNLWKSPAIKRTTDRPDYATGQRVITIFYDFVSIQAKEVYTVSL